MIHSSPQKTIPVKPRPSSTSHAKSKKSESMNPRCSEKDLKVLKEDKMFFQKLILTRQRPADLMNSPSKGLNRGSGLSKERGSQTKQEKEEVRDISNYKQMRFFEVVLLFDEMYSKLNNISFDVNGALNVHKCEMKNNREYNISTMQHINHIIEIGEYILLHSPKSRTEYNKQVDARMGKVMEDVSRKIINLRLKYTILNHMVVIDSNRPVSYDSRMYSSHQQVHIDEKLFESGKVGTSRKYSSNEIDGIFDRLYRSGDLFKPLIDSPKEDEQVAIPIENNSVKNQQVPKIKKLKKSVISPKKKFVKAKVDSGLSKSAVPIKVDPVEISNGGTIGNILEDIKENLSDSISKSEEPHEGVEDKQEKANNLAALERWKLAINRIRSKASDIDNTKRQIIRQSINITNGVALLASQINIMAQNK